MTRWRIVLEGDMPYPLGRIETVSDAEPVPVVVVPPAPRPAPVEADSLADFEWPAPPGELNRGPEMRAAWVWVDVPTGLSYYLQLPEFGNPLPAAYRYAGMTPIRTFGDIPRECRLWAPLAGKRSIVEAILRGDLPLSH